MAPDFLRIDGFLIFKNMYLKLAQEYLSYGYSTIPCDINKACIAPGWKKYEQEINKELTYFEKAELIAIACGKASGGLEIIDFDLKHRLDFDFEELLRTIEEHTGETYPIIKTINNGYHLYFKSGNCGNNQVLASIEVLNPNGKTVKKALIETRGQGGYVIAPDNVHYFLSGKKNIDETPFITDEQRDCILSICKSYNEVAVKLEKPAIHKEIKSLYLKTPFDDFNDKNSCVKILEEIGWKLAYFNNKNYALTRPGKNKGVSGTVCKHTNVFYCFTSSTEFEANTAYSACQLVAKIKGISDWSAYSKDLKQKGYGYSIDSIKPDVFKKIQESYKRGGRVDAFESMEGIREELKPILIERIEKSEDVILHQFWEVDKNNKPKIKPSSLINFFKNVLCVSIKKEGKAFRLVQNDNNIIKQINRGELKNLIKKWIEENYDSINVDVTLIQDALIKSPQMFNDEASEWFYDFSGDFVEDTKDVAHFFYRNGICLVTSEGVKFKKYSEIHNLFVWENNLIDRDYIEISEPESNWVDFCRKISGEKYDYLRSLIGFNLHRYKDEQLQLATFIAEDVEDSSKGGGAGKGLLLKAIGKMFKTCEMDGEMLATAKSFPFQAYELGMPVVAVNDASLSMNWDSFKSIITDGLTIEKKNKDQLYLDFKKAPKFIFTSNYSLPTDKDFITRRFKILTLKPYFTRKHRPMDEYNGETFFLWNDNEWAHFDNWMLNCIVFYLKNGIINNEVSDSYVRKEFTVIFGTPIFEFLSNTTPIDNAPLKKYYEYFLSENALKESMYKFEKFKRAINNYEERFGLNFIMRKNPNAQNSYYTFSSNEMAEDCTTTNDDLIF